MYLNVRTDDCFKTKKVEKSYWHETIVMYLI